MGLISARNEKQNFVLIRESLKGTCWLSGSWQWLAVPAILLRTGTRHVYQSPASLCDVKDRPSRLRDQLLCTP